MLSVEVENELYNVINSNYNAGNSVEGIVVTHQLLHLLKKNGGNTLFGTLGCASFINVTTYGQGFPQQKCAKTFQQILI